MDIVVKGRNVAVPEHYRVHVAEKLTRVERYDHKATRYDVELFHERNPRQAKSCQRVEITGRCRSGVIRAEACGPDFYAALDTALGKLENRLRRAADRRKVHHGRRRATSVAEATAPLAAVLAGADGSDSSGASPTASAGTSPGVPDRQPAAADRYATAQRHEPSGGAGPGTDYALPSQRGASWDTSSGTSHGTSDGSFTDGEGPGRIVRRKRHSSAPMTVDQALYEMELVGHDFYLFSDADSGLPSVVYRRRGFHYGVIQLA